MTDFQIVLAYAAAMVCVLGVLLMQRAAAGAVARRSRAAGAIVVAAGFAGTLYFAAYALLQTAHQAPYRARMTRVAPQRPPAVPVPAAGEAAPPPVEIQARHRAEYAL